MSYKNIQAQRINGLAAEIAAVGGVTGSGTLNYIPKWTPSGIVIGNSQIYDNGTNVGIGTNSPQSKLDVIGTTRLVPFNVSWDFGWNGGELFVRGNTGGEPVIKLHTSVSNEYVEFMNPLNPNGSNGWKIGRSSNDFKIKGNINNDINGIASDIITILGSNGNVGIGTNTPLAKLHVDGGNGSNVQIYLKSTGNDNGIQIDSGGYPFFNMKTNGVNSITLQGNGTSILFRPNQNVEWRSGDTNSSMYGSVNMDVAANSYSYFSHNLGVGTSSPSKKLHIVGYSGNGVLAQLNDSMFDVALSGSAGQLRFSYGSNIEFMMNPYPSAFNTSFRFKSNPSGNSGENGIEHTVLANISSNGGLVIGEALNIDTSGTNSGTIWGKVIRKSGYANTNATFYPLIALDGNVGIGTSTPVTKLEVNGTITLTSLSNTINIGAYTAIMMSQGVGASNISIGHSNTLNDADNGGAIAIGQGVTSSSDGIAIGLSSTVSSGTTDGIAIGRGATVNNSSIRGLAIGRDSLTNASNAFAIGNYTTASQDDTIILGNNSLGNKQKVGIATSTPNTRLDVDGDVAYRTDNDAVIISTDTDNLSTLNRSFLRLDNNSGSSKNITGFANGSNGKRLVISNVSTVDDIVIRHQSINSSATNRVITGNLGSDNTLKPDDTIELIYDSTSQRWRIINHSAG